MLGDFIAKSQASNRPWNKLLRLRTPLSSYCKLTWNSLPLTHAILKAHLHHNPINQARSPSTSTSARIPARVLKSHARSRTPRNSTMNRIVTPNPRVATRKTTTMTIFKKILLNHAVPSRSLLPLFCRKRSDSKLGQNLRRNRLRKRPRHPYHLQRRLRILAMA